jgi:hypothetical protein
VAEWNEVRVAGRLREALALQRHGTGEPDAVARTAEALSWLSWLDPEDARIVRARAEGSPWKLICWRFAIGRATAHRRWQYGLSLIAWRLNGRQLPAKRSRRRFLELARASTGM